MIDNLKNKTLLYAEDEINVQNQYATYFKNIFKSVYVANDGKEALLMFKQEKPDIVVLDINMPKINGIDLTKEIKQLNSKVPIILLTARSDKDTLKKAIELQLLTYLEKPVSRMDLKNALFKLANYFEDKDIIKLWELENTSFHWNKSKKILYANNENMKLTKKEILLFELLIEKKGFCNYQDIYEFVWSDSDKKYCESTIKTLISSLKSKLPKDTIKNQYGVGYTLSIKI